MITSRLDLPLPARRPRRLRATGSLRGLVRETESDARSLIQPVFVAEALTEPMPIASMPGQRQETLASVVETGRRAVALGLGGILVFGVPARKDREGSEAWAPGGISQRAISALRDAVGDSLTVVADLCLCEYTDHGHCGVPDGVDVDNDRTLDLYQRIAVSQAAAGAGMIAPSGMMDGQVAAIRSALDQSGFSGIPIMAYAAKYASGFYGPFREAAGSTPQFGDRRSYQMDPANRREALAELEQDLAEGADILMVKPALVYLDVVAEARSRFDVPIAAYNVSAEYSMVRAAAERGWIDEPRVVLEILSSIRRAGADIIISYHALEAAGWLRSA